MTQRRWLALGAALAAAFSAHGQNSTMVNKSANYVQTSSSGSVASTVTAPFYFSIQAPTATTVVPPGGASFQLPANSGNGDYELDVAYQTKAAMDAAYPNGTYVLTPTGSSAISFPITPDLYPTVPAVTSGGTWQNGVLVVDPAVTTTINFNTFATYGQGAGSHQEFDLSSNNDNSVNLKQELISVSGLGLPYATTPFTSYVIPSGTLKAGFVYSANLDYDALSYLNTTSGLYVGIFSTSTNFYIVGKPATTVPPPVVASQPASLTVPLGGSATFAAIMTFAGSSQPPANVSFIWYANGQPINFNGTKYIANGATMVINPIAASDAGTYALEVVDAGGFVDTQAVTLTIGTAAAPVIVSQPANQTVNSGGSTSFTVNAGGAGPFTYQWSFNGTPLTQGGNTQTYNVNAVTTAKAGVYTVTVTNSGGSVTSLGATLTVNPVAAPPTITRQPVAQTLPAGATVAFNVGVTAFPAATYQWFFNVGSATPVAISGATSSRYVLSNVQSANGGNYSCRVTNSSGVTSTNQVLLSVLTVSPTPGHMVNLSILSNVSGSLSMGFVLGGAGTSGSINVLIRGVGPAIGPGTVFNVGGIMVDPTLSVLQQTDHTKSFANSGWGSNQAAVTTADNATGAFALTNPASADSALVASLSGVSGGYSATVAGKTGDSGNALTEVYDASGATYSPTNPRLINLSCLTNISAGSTLDVGFVIGGTTAKTVLIRASGPAIGPGTLFNVGGVMADPQIVVSTAAAATIAIASNAGWGGDAVLTTIGNGLGAFAYTNANSLDSAAVVTLEPNVPYAVQVNSASGGGGNVLVEIYDVNP